MATQAAGIRQFAGLAAHVPGGFTLIELVVVIAITVAAMLVAVPLTTSWVDSARVNEAQGLFQQAFSRTKALALRNGSVATASDPAASLCQNGNVLYVYSGLPGTCGTGSYVWQGIVPGDGNTQIQLNSATFSCLALNNAGIPVATTINTTACAQSSSYTISKGVQSVSKTLF